MDKPWLPIAGGLFTLFLLNYFIMAWWGTPALYCFGRWALMPLFAPWWSFVLPALGLVFLYVLFAQKGWQTCVGVAALMVLAGGMPDFLRTLGALGGQCGG